MANIVLVTKQCYLLCEAINYISVEEIKDEDSELELFISSRPRKKNKKKKLTPKQKLLNNLKTENKLYQIQIDFVPVPCTSTNNSSRGRESLVTISVRGQNSCLTLYREILKQIREQQPDKLFLDKLVDQFFSDNGVDEE